MVEQKQFQQSRGRREILRLFAVKDTVLQKLERRSKVAGGNSDITIWTSVLCATGEYATWSPEMEKASTPQSSEGGGL